MAELLQVSVVNGFVVGWEMGSIRHQEPRIIWSVHPVQLDEEVDEEEDKRNNDK